MKLQRLIFHLRVPFSVILGNLTKTAGRIAYIAQVEQDRFLFHATKVENNWELGMRN